MIADTVLLLIVIALFSSLKIGIKTDGVLARLLFLFVSVLCFYFYKHGGDSAEQVFSFVWNSSPSGNIMFDIVSNPYNCRLILPFFFMSALAIGYNIVFRYEERRCIFDAVLLYNLTALIIMITSNNLVQLLSGLFAIDVLALLMIRNVESSSWYATLNLIADMVLFTVFAVINCQLESLDMRQILQYNRIGLHRDFVAAAGLAAVFIKFGMLPFHSGMLHLRDIRFHRLQTVLFLTSPAAALILLLKFNLLWQSSAYFAPLLRGVCIFSVVWSAICLFTAENLKVKVIFMQLLFWPSFVLLLQINNFEWSKNFTLLLLCQYLCISIIYFLYYKANRCVSLLKLRNFCVADYYVCRAAGAVFCLFFAAEMSLGYLLGAGQSLYFMGIGCLAAISAAQIFHQFCFRGKVRESGKLPLRRKKMFWVITLPAAVMSGMLMFPQVSALPQLKIFLGSMLIWWLMVFIPIPKAVYKIYAGSALQKNDVWSLVYKNFISEPVLWCGRVLSVIIDRMVVEKMILGLTSLCLQGAIRLFRNMHYNRVWGGLIMLLLLAALWCVSFYAGGTN